MRKHLTELEGKIFSSVEGMEEGSESVVFYINGEPMFKMMHPQSCCEDVRIEDVCGDLGSIVGTPIISFTEDEETKESDYCSEEWTFYNIDTVKGSITLRWYGVSNGYYGTSVYIYDNSEQHYW